SIGGSSTPSENSITKLLDFLVNWATTFFETQSLSPVSVISKGMTFLTPNNPNLEVLDIDLIGFANWTVIEMVLSPSLRNRRLEAMAKPASKVGGIFLSPKANQLSS